MNLETKDKGNGRIREAVRAKTMISRESNQIASTVSQVAGILDQSKVDDAMEKNSTLLRKKKVTIQTPRVKG